MGYTYSHFAPDGDVEELKRKKELAESEMQKQSDTVTAARAAYDKAVAGKPKAWNGGDYGKEISEAYRLMSERAPFTYDPNTDALYQQYRDRYISQGRLAMQDTMGQAAALTGGYGNSYAQTVGQQTYDRYMDGLNDMIPELYQLALQRYESEGQELSNRLSAAQSLYGQQYGEYRDAVNDRNAEIDRAYNIFANERANDQTIRADARDYAANAYNNAYAQNYQRAMDEAEIQMNIDQFDRTMAENQRQYDESMEASRAAAGSGKDITGDIKKEIDNILTKYWDNDTNDDRLDEELTKLANAYPEYSFEQIYLYANQHKNGITNQGLLPGENGTYVDDYGKAVDFDSLPYDVKMALLQLGNGERYGGKKY